MYFEHNIEVYDRFKPMILKYKECCLVSCVGSGKSDIAIEFIKEFKLNTLIICPTVSNCDRWDKLSRVTNVSTISTITYHSFYKGFAALSCRFDAYIFDEAHHMDSQVWGKSIRKFKNMMDGKVFIIGLTADPIRYSDNCKNVIETMFNNRIVFGYSQYDAISKGILPEAEYVCAIFDTKGIYDKYSKYKMTKELRGKLDFSFNNCKKISDILLEHAPQNTKGIVFVENIAAVDEGLDLIKSVFNTDFVWPIHSKLSRYQINTTIDTFEKSETGFLIAVNMFNEGHHVDGVNTIIMLRKTSSKSVLTQQIGRGLSAKATGKTIIFDFVGNTTSLKYITNKSATKIKKTISELFKIYFNISKQTIIHNYAADILEVLKEIDEYNDRNWSEEEEQILKDNYCDMGLDVYKLLPRKTKSACQGKAHILGLKHCIKWTPEEDEIIREQYPTMGAEVSVLLKNRTAMACTRRARLIGVKYDNLGRAWTPEEDEIIREHYPTMGGEVYKLLPSYRSANHCAARAYALGVKKNKNIWTPEEDEIIREHYPTIGGDVCKLLPDKSRQECHRRARRLKIATTRSNKQWSHEELQLLQEKYMDITEENVAYLFPNRSYQACKKMCSILGLTINSNYSRSSWSNSELQILIENYPTMGEDVYKLLPGRDEKSCVNKAHTLKLRKNNSGDKWTPNEDKILIDNYPTMGSDIFKLLKNRSRHSCQSRAYYLGLSKNTKDKEE